MTRVKSKRSISAVAIMGLAFLTAMCGERDGAKVKVHPQSPDGKGAAGDDNGSLGAAGEPSAGSGGSSGTAGTSNGSATGGSGGTSDPTAGEGPGSGGSGATAAMSATGGSDNTTGGTGATGGSADSGGTDQTGGTGGGSAATGGASSGTAGTAANGGSGSGAGGSGTAGFGGLPVSCELKTNCCAPDDPPCGVEGGWCPSGDDFCCNADVGMRQPCVAGTEIEQIACLNCEGVSFGTGSCANCFDEADPLCSDPTWDDPCLTGGDAYCSDPDLGFRLACNGIAGGEYYAYLACTCSAGATCAPTPCCDASSPVCETDGCVPADGFGYCCSSTLHYSESCTDLGDGSVAGQQRICINDCTGQSYGTGSCADCTIPGDPPCDTTADWMTACNQIEPVYCSDLDAGYRMRCLERLRTSGSSYPDIEIVCACNAPP